MRQPTSASCRCWTTGRLIGLLDESDLLRGGRGRARQPEARFRQPVASAMTAAAQITLQAAEPLDALLPIFERDEVAIVMDGDEFLG